MSTTAQRDVHLAGVLSAPLIPKGSLSCQESTRSTSASTPSEMASNGEGSPPRHVQEQLRWIDMDSCSSEDDVTSVCRELDNNAPGATKSRRRRHRRSRNKQAKKKSSALSASDTLNSDALEKPVFDDRAAQTLAALGLLSPLESACPSSPGVPFAGPAEVLATGPPLSHCHQSTYSPAVSQTPNMQLVHMNVVYVQHPFVLPMPNACGAFRVEPYCN